jgi:hypothetical protein
MYFEGSSCIVYLAQDILLDIQVSIIITPRGISMKYDLHIIHICDDRIPMAVISDRQINLMRLVIRITGGFNFVHRPVF